MRRNRTGQCSVACACLVLTSSVIPHDAHDYYSELIASLVESNGERLWKVTLEGLDICDTFRVEGCLERLNERLQRFVDVRKTLRRAAFMQNFKTKDALIEQALRQQEQASVIYEDFAFEENALAK